MMSLLDLLQTIGRAPPGTRALVAEQFDAVDAHSGGAVTLPIGTRIEISLASGQSLAAVAEVGDKLHKVYLFVEHYPMLALGPR